MMIYNYYSMSTEDRLKKVKKDIKEYRSDKRKIVFRKGLCYSAGIGFLATAGLIVPTIITVLGCNFNHSPFKRDEVVTPAHPTSLLPSRKDIFVICNFLYKIR